MEDSDENTPSFDVGGGIDSQRGGGFVEEVMESTPRFSPHEQAAKLDLPSGNSLFSQLLLSSIFFILVYLLIYLLLFF